MQKPDQNLKNSQAQKKVPENHTDNQQLSPEERAAINRIIFIFIILMIALGIFLANSFLKIPSFKLDINSLYKTKVGKTTEQEVQKLNIKEKEASSGGSTVYKLESLKQDRPDQVITENGVVVFERRYIPVDPDDPKYIKISQLTSSLGEPEKVIEGSIYYGLHMSTYIYAKKGMAFIGNSYTNEVFEVQTFLPMTVDEYINKYGQDTKRGSKSEEELL